MNRPEFSVYWWDREGGQHEESRFIEVDLALHQAKRLSQGPASAVLGMVNRVIITDGLDCIVFEWKKDEGITWPTKEMLAQAN